MVNISSLLETNIFEYFTTFQALKLIFRWEYLMTIDEELQFYITGTERSVKEELVKLPFAVKEAIEAPK